MKQQSWSPHELILGTLHICYGCVGRCSFGTPNSGNEGISDPLVCALDSFLPTKLPPAALRRGCVPSLIVSCYAVFARHPWEACPFLKGNRGSMDLRREGREGWV